MELMNYDRINKNKSNAPIVFVLLFIFLGTGIIAYGIINEPKPQVIGENALISVDSVYVEEEIKQEIKYTVTSIARTENNTNYKASIIVPQIAVDGVILTDINTQIKERFHSKYDSLATEGNDSLENTFLYKVQFSKYESTIKDTKLLSLVFTESITAKDDETFSKKMYAYVVDLNNKVLLGQDDIGALVLGYGYRNILKSSLKKAIVENNLEQEDEYSYALTGLEECYVKDEIMHIVFNSKEPFEKLGDILDIEIQNDDEI